MIRHDLHCHDTELVFCRQLLKHFLQVRIHTVPKELLPVLRAPDDMVLQRVHISPTICKICKLNTINVIININYTISGLRKQAKPNICSVSGCDKCRPFLPLLPGGTLKITELLSINVISQTTGLLLLYKCG